MSDLYLTEDADVQYQTLNQLNRQRQHSSQFHFKTQICPHHLYRRQHALDHNQPKTYKTNLTTTIYQP